MLRHNFGLFFNIVDPTEKRLISKTLISGVACLSKKFYRRRAVETDMLLLGTRAVSLESGPLSSYPVVQLAPAVGYTSYACI